MYPVTSCYIFGVLSVMQYMSPVIEAMPGALGNVITMPPQCADQDYCTVRHELYPREIVNTLLHNSLLTLLDTKTQVIAREGDELPDCPYKGSDDPIYEVKDENGDVRVVVQSPNFQQIVRLEWCTTPGRLVNATFNFSQSTLSFFNISCDTKKIDYNFVVLNHAWTDLEVIKTKQLIPVCCSCKYNGAPGYEEQQD